MTPQTETSKNLAFILFHKITKAWHIVLNLSCYLEWSASTKITRLLLFLATFIFCLVIKRGKKQFIFIYYFEGSNSDNLLESNNTQMRRRDVGFKVQFCSCSLPALNWWQIEAIRLIRTWKKSEHSPARLHLSKNSTWVIIKNKKKGAEQSILLYHVSGSKKATTILTGFMIEIHDKTHCPVHGSITRSNHNSIIYSWTTVYLFFDYHYFHRKDPKSKWLVDQQSGKD